MARIFTHDQTEREPLEPYPPSPDYLVVEEQAPGLFKILWRTRDGIFVSGCTTELGHYR
jgi:hypothetical protein